MKELFLSDFPFSVPEAAFLKAARIDRDEDPDLADEALAVLADGLSAARPKAFCRLLPVRVEGGTAFLGEQPVHSAFVAEKLSGCAVCAPFVSTCGTEVEDWSGALTDPLARFWADTLKLLLLASAGQALKAAAARDLLPGAGYLASLNPGSLPAWPLEGQTELFRALGPGAAATGVRLTPSMLMLPAKSGSGILFDSRARYENCAHCDKLDCPNRRAPFTQKLPDRSK
ncbi:MAG: hypothetical protein IJL69_05370 [Oscillospiraceae bacterium]|nr:hypothetical protein [Oscillospiraceae bacterium]